MKWNSAHEIALIAVLLGIAALSTLTLAYLSGSTKMLTLGGFTLAAAVVQFRRYRHSSRPGS